MMKKNLFFTIPAVVFMVLSACNKEEPIPVSAEFTTNIQNSTLAPAQGFTIYLDETAGEFLAYFKGDQEKTTWGTGSGTTIEVGTDSLRIAGYGVEGTYTFTLVATSYGNWGETVAQDVQSIDINVVAAR